MFVSTATEEPLDHRGTLRRPTGRDAIRSLFDKAGIRIDGRRPWDIRVLHPHFYRRVLAEGSLGLGESYMDGWWEAESLDSFFHRLLRARVDRRLLFTPTLLLDSLKARFLNLQSRERSQRVARRHYDLGNAFYERMLDPHMQYTCGYWKSAPNLAAAQEAKLDLICRKLHLGEGDRVLELGGGWGGFARFAAERYGCEVTVYNISREQVAYARRLCEGLPVTIHQEDYRNARGGFDKVVSIGMCEHVGSANHAEFFRLQRRVMKPDGLMLLHTIGRMESKRTSDPWFTRYIFPGGQLPSLRQLTRASEGVFALEDLHSIGADYDPTLMSWHRNFECSWPEFSETLGERFYRMWRYYLLSCAGAFRARRIHLWQCVYSPDGVEGGYVPSR